MECHYIIYIRTFRSHLNCNICVVTVIANRAKISGLEDISLHMNEGCHSLGSRAGTIVELIQYNYFTLFKTKMIHNVTISFTASIL